MKILNKFIWSKKEPSNKNDIWFDGSTWRMYTEEAWQSFTLPVDAADKVAKVIENASEVYQEKLNAGYGIIIEGNTISLDVSSIDIDTTHNIGSIELFNQLIIDRSHYSLNEEDINAISEGKLITTTNKFNTKIPITTINHMTQADEVVGYYLVFYVDQLLYRMYIDTSPCSIIGGLSIKENLSNKWLSTNDYTNEDKEKLYEVKQTTEELEQQLAELSEEINGNSLQKISAISGVAISTSTRHPLVLKAGNVKATKIDNDNILSTSYISCYFYDASGTMVKKQAIYKIGTSFVLDADVVEFACYASTDEVVNTGDLYIQFEADGLKESIREEVESIREGKNPNSISAEMLKPLQEPRFASYDRYDMNQVIEEVYIFPEYISQGKFNVRAYNKGIILGCFSTNTRLWAVREYYIADNYANENVYPLVVNVTTSEVAEGTHIGYIVYKDIEGFKALSNDSEDGAELNVGMAKQLFLSPKIFTFSANNNNNENSTPSLLNGVNITLPSEITAIVGDNMQIFWRSIISAANPYIFDIYAVSLVGKSYPRYYEFKPTSDMIGKSYQIEIYVKANDGTIVAKKTATIKVKASMTAPSANKNVLCIGASATAGGQWVGELKRRLTDTSGDGTSANPTGLGLSNIAFVGRKNGSVNPVNLEATGGWKVQEYASKGNKAVRFFVTGVETISLGARYSCNGVIYGVQEVNVTNGTGNIRCTLEHAFVEPTGILTKVSGSGDTEITFTSYEEEFFSPFWNDDESRIDFRQYADNYCGGSIDCLVWHCGVNDITSGDSSVIPNVIAAFHELLDAYREQFPQGKVVISSVPIGSVNGGFAANYGANGGLNYYTFAKIAQLYAQALVELTNEDAYKGFVYYAPALEQFDAENGYPVKQIAVNNRSSVTEAVGTNGVHPTDAGSYMVADAIYRTINAMNL